MVNPNKPLTKMQQLVFDFICQYAEEEGSPPSYSDIAAHFNFSSDGTVRTYLEHLEGKGFIKRLGRARGLQILKKPDLRSIPIVGQIAAGSPTLAIETFDGTLSDIKELQQKEGRIALRVAGDSMVNAGILSGDLAIIQTGIPVKNGQIAAVMIEDSATLKRLFIENTCIRLEAENDNYNPIILDKNDYETRIIGKYIALVRCG